MWKSFAKDKNNDDDDVEIELNPMNTSKAWAIESTLLDMYLVLIHRIEGLGWSLNDFWEADTWTTAKLYLAELDLIDEEEKKLNESEDEKYDSEDMKDLYSEMYGDED